MSRSSTIPQERPTIGNVTAATPNVACSTHDRPRPTIPPASNQIARTASSPTTTDATPRASRAHGDRIWRTGVFAGRLERFAAVRLFGERRELLERLELPDARDVERRREGEVFVGMGP
jgi:hypothetical protein